MEKATVEVTMLMSPELVEALKAGSPPVRITLHEPETSGGYWELEAHYVPECESEDKA